MIILLIPSVLNHYKAKKEVPGTCNICKGSSGTGL